MFQQIKITFIICFSVFLLSSCQATTTKQFSIDPSVSALEAERQKRLVYQAHYDKVARVQGIANTMLREGANFCGDKVHYYTDLQLTNHASIKSQFGQDWIAAINRITPLDSNGRPTIYFVTPGGPADKAGLQVGDTVLSVGGREARKGIRGLQRIERFLEDTLEDGPKTIPVRISRAGETMTMRIQPELYCDSHASLTQDAAINAFADGNRIYITDGMLNFVDDDAQLAQVIGHEIAHNAMLHIEKKQANAAGGAILGVLFDGLAAAAGVNTEGVFTQAAMNAGAQAYSVEFEQEADYVGAYLMENAGYDISQTPDFWRKMATVNPNSVTYAGTHPTTTDRFLVLEQIVNEINMKRIQKIAMVPDLKEEDGEGSVLPDTLLGAGENRTALADSGSGNPRAGSPASSAGFVSGGSGAASSAGEVASPEAKIALLLGSYSNLKNAEESLSLQQNEHPDLLDGLMLVLHESEKDGDSVYELLAGPFSERHEAQNRCVDFIDRSVFCQLREAGEIRWE